MLQEIGITAIIGCNYFCNALYNLLIAKDKIQRTYAQKVIIINQLDYFFFKKRMICLIKNFLFQSLRVNTNIFYSDFTLIVIVTVLFFCELIDNYEFVLNLCE